MATKSQNKGLAALSFRLCMLIASVVFISCAGVLSCEKSVVFQSYFHSSESIKSEAVRYAKNLQRYYVYFRNFDPTAAERKLGEIDEHIKEKGNKKKEITENSSYYDVNTDYNAGGEDVVLESYNNMVYGKPSELYLFNKSELDTMTEEEISSLENNLSEALQNYYSVRNYLDTTEHFHYYIYDTTRGRLIATNADNFDKETVYDSISITDELFSDVSFNNSYLSESFVNNGLECTLSIPVNTNSYFIENEVSRVQHLLKANRVTASPITSLLLIVSGLILFAYVMYADKGLVERVNAKIYSHISRLPAILKLFALGICIWLYISHYEKHYIVSSLISYGRWDKVIMLMAVAFAVTVFAIGVFENIFKVIRNPGLFFYEADVNFAAVSVKNFRFAINTRSYLLIFIYISVSLLFVAYFFGMLFILPSAFKRFENMLIYLALCFPFFIIAMVIKLINAHIKLSWYIREMSLGNIETIPKQHGLFVEPLNNLNNINDGVKATMEKAIKNERLKSELITNVSHDLKTPLTSIISYVNLLKELKLDSSAADEYIRVIENKATRLKVLIDDLFEASKLSSGQMKLEKNKSDVVSLLRQTMGELSYKIEESGIEFKTDLPENPVILNIDGQKMWRVFDNLLNNILKYSPKGSRAYIDITDKEDRTVITFKNVSSYSLDFDTGELFERFKRGDAARATEGSGLGLSIAKSIVELHEGSMSIVTDGDLFKIIIVLYK